jgi:hypothetical protein
MDSQIEWKKNIYAQIAVQFNKNNVKHAAVHGIDYSLNYYGRDVDIMIYYADRKLAREIIYSVFEENKIKFKNNIFLWADWIIGYTIIEDRIFYIEIDLFYHIYYRYFELTSDKGLSVSEKDTDCFYIDCWNTYAKVVLTKFIGLDFCKLSDKQLKEVIRIVHLYKPVSSNQFFKDELLTNLNHAIVTNDFKGISRLKSEIKPIKVIKKNPLKSFFVFFKCLMYAFQRKIKAFGIIPVIVVSDKTSDNIEQITTLLNESFFTKINVTNKALKVLSIGYLLKIYIQLRKKSEPLTLNIVTLNDKTLEFVSSNFFMRFIFRFLNMLIIDMDKENVQTNDILIKILEQTVKK